MNYNPSSFVIEFISVSDIPLIDGKTKINAFISAYLSSPISKMDSDGRNIIPGLEQVGPTVYTPKRYDCTSAVFNCYRNFYTQPVHDSILTVELLHYYSQNSTQKSFMMSDNMIGKVDIPVRLLISDELPRTFPMTLKVLLAYRPKK